MATREIITVDLKGQDIKRLGFNVSDTVGVGGTNNFGDVLLIQAMFQFFRLGVPKVVENIVKEQRKPSGFLDTKTGREIKRFQRERSIDQLAQDGLVHPGSFKNRRLKIGGQQMMIYQLNRVAVMASVFLVKDVDYTEVILRQFPELRAWVKDV